MAVLDKFFEGRRSSLNPQRRIPPPLRPGFSWAIAVSASLAAVLILVVPAYLILQMAGARSELLDTLLQPRTWRIVGNTIALAAAVTLGSTILSVPLAWLLVCTDIPGKRLWVILAALPLVIPSYVSAYLYASLLSPKGVLQQWMFPLTGIERLPNLYGFPGAFIVLTLITYPFTFLTVRSALLRMDPSFLEAARSLGHSPWSAFRRVTLPYLRPAMLAGGLLVALYCFRDFGAVTMLQYSTFTRIIYNRYLAYQLDSAAAMALVLMILTAVILCLEYRGRGKGRYARLSAGAARKMVPIRLGRWKAVALFYVITIVFWALVTPVGGLLYWIGRGWRQDWLVRNTESIQSNLYSALDLLEPALHSLTASTASAFLAILLALPIVIWSVRYKSRTGQMIERIVYASFALPGIVVALAYVFAGTTYVRSLYQTLPMLLAAYVILFLPQTVGAQRTALGQVSTNLEEAGRTLGHRPFAVFRRITLPLVRSGIVAGGLLVFLTCMKELPATLILSPLGFRTLAVVVWGNVSEAFFARAAIPTLVLLLLSSLPLAWLTIREKAL